MYFNEAWNARASLVKRPVMGSSTTPAWHPPPRHSKVDLQETRGSPPSIASFHIKLLFLEDLET